jgi:Family of unknown function (DUF5330)
MRKNVPAERTPPSMLSASFPTRAAEYVAGDVGLMFFLLRMSFWLGLVLILLPTGSSQQAPANQVVASDAISAASATVGDLRQFCTRQPDACIVGSHVATALGYKAQAGAKMLYDFLTDALAPKETGSLAAGGSIKAAMDKLSTDKASQNTLNPADLTPAWRGPTPRKDAKHSA